jgi:hypothetical protein
MTSMGYLAAWFELHLRGEGKSAKTVRIYLTALRHFSGWAQDRYPDLLDWQAVGSLTSTSTYTADGPCGSHIASFWVIASVRDASGQTWTTPWGSSILIAPTG